MNIEYYCASKYGADCKSWMNEMRTVFRLLALQSKDVKRVSYNVYNISSDFSEDTGQGDSGCSAIVLRPVSNKRGLPVYLRPDAIAKISDRRLQWIEGDLEIV